MSEAGITEIKNNRSNKVNIYRKEDVRFSVRDKFYISGFKTKLEKILIVIDLR
ncbi:6625_t:CDS:1, partial [Scutellospora calospora]